MNIDLTQIKELIIKTERTKIYSMSGITDTYNTIFNKNEKQTSCGSCLRNLFIKIKNWYNKEIEVKENEVLIIEPIVEEITEHLTLEVAREEITIINEALEDGVIEPALPEAELSNDRLVEVITEKRRGKKK